MGGGIWIWYITATVNTYKNLSAIRILVCEAEDKRPHVCCKYMWVNIDEIILIELVVKVWNGWNWSLEPCLQ